MTLSAAEASRQTRAICALAPIVPVVVIDDAACARPLAKALIAGGLPALEVTLRTPAALEAIRIMAGVTGGHVGAGTLVTPDDLRAAKAAGGAPALKAIGAPLPQITFCPTGGVSPANAESYLSLDNVLCVGGSWVAPKALVNAGDWAGVEALARKAAKLGRVG